MKRTSQDYFEKIEERISNLYDDLEIKLIKPTNDYLKIYAKLYAANGKILLHFGLWKTGKKELLSPKIIWVFRLLERLL